MKGEKCVNVCDSLLLIVKFEQMCVLIYGKEGFFADQMPVCLIVGVEML